MRSKPLLELPEQQGRKVNFGRDSRSPLRTVGSLASHNFAQSTDRYPNDHSVVPLPAESLHLILSDAIAAWPFGILRALELPYPKTISERPLWERGAKLSM